MNFYTKTKAFTIIELLVAVAIMGLLMSIMTANFGESRKKSRDAKRVSDIVQLQLALELYFDRCNLYPTVATGMPNAWENNMPALASNTGCPTDISLATFINKIPNPPTTADYVYAVNNATTPTDYVLRAKLETISQALQDDVNGTVVMDGTSIDCSNATYNYCVQPR